ncbi:Golgi organization [Mactra antiquata]
MDIMHKRQYSDNISQIKTSKPCRLCGCTCDGKFLTDPRHSLDLQQQIEELHSDLLRSKSHISNMEHEYDNRLQSSNYEILKLREDFVKLRDRYERLMESHKRMQKINDNLENKLLNVVNSTESEKTLLQKEVASMTSKLVDAKSYVCDLEEENERYRNDCNWAVQLLQCKPSNFVSQKLQTLPLGLQDRVKCHMTNEQLANLQNGSQETTKLIHVPMQTFPPTAMVYSVPKQKDSLPNESSENQDVPTNLIAKVLTQPEIKRRPVFSYFCVNCREDFFHSHKETQVNLAKEKERTKMAVKVHRKVRSQSSCSSNEAES